MNKDKSKQLKFWTGPWPWVLIVVLLACSAWLGFGARAVPGRKLPAVMSIIGAVAAFMMLSVTTRIRKILKENEEKAREREAAAAAAPQAAPAEDAADDDTVAGGDDADNEDEDDEEEYEFPFLRLMDNRSRLYTCCETRSWYAIQFQTIATPSARGDKLAPNWFPGDVDRDYATKQDIWIAKSDFTGYELDSFPVPNLPWPNSGTLTLKAGENKYSFALLGDVDEEELEDFFRR